MRSTRKAGACGGRCSRVEFPLGVPEGKNVRESRDPRWQLEQHREQPAVLESEQQRPDEREQQHRVSCSQAHGCASPIISVRVRSQRFRPELRVSKRGDAAAVPGSGTTGASGASVILAMAGGRSRRAPPWQVGRSRKPWRGLPFGWDKETHRVPHSHGTP